MNKKIKKIIFLILVMGIIGTIVFTHKVKADVIYNLLADDNGITWQYSYNPETKSLGISFFESDSDITEIELPNKDFFIQRDDSIDVVDDYDDMTVGINRVLNRVNNDKYQAVNFNHVNDFSEYGNYNTVEFRCPNGTLDPVIWQNNLNLFVKLIQYSKRDDFNNDLINERRKINEDFVESDNDFTKIYLRQALEFADLIFFNNADKVYFLRQYLKNYQCGDKEFERAKPFTKTFR